MMIFVTNIWNHYTTNLGERLARILGVENFRLVLVSPIQDDPLFRRKLKMGWKFDLPDYPWLVPNPRSANDFKSSEHVRLIKNAEVAVIDSLFYNKHLVHAVSSRIKCGRLTFFANERFAEFKKPLVFWDCLKPKTLARWWLTHKRYAHANVHYLPMSHYGLDDIHFFDAAHGRVWKWGYFPEVSTKPTEKPDDGVFRIGWCGRMIAWKHVENIVRAVSLLPVEYRKKCQVTLVGEGVCRDDLIKMASDMGLNDCITFKPYMPVAEVKKVMSGLDAYIFPSDRGEGWGVALAEAMDLCCVPIACVEAGASLELIDDGENGFVFEKNDAGRIARKIMWLIDHPGEKKRISENAWRTMQQRSPDIGAQRLAQLIKAVQTGDENLIPKEGICSTAEVR